MISSNLFTFLFLSLICTIRPPVRSSASDLRIFRLSAWYCDLLKALDRPRTALLLPLTITSSEYLPARSGAALIVDLLSLILEHQEDSD
jgi:hypothetical protein